MLIFLIVVAAAIPPNLVEVTTANFESTLRRSPDNWIYALADPKHDLQLLNLLSSLADAHPDYKFAYTDISTETGELIKASFEAAITPQLFYITE
jgi:hypothetical protein